MYRVMYTYYYIGRLFYCVLLYERKRCGKYFSIIACAAFVSSTANPSGNIYKDFTIISRKWLQWRYQG